jgi:hypothetical protein
MTEYDLLIADDASMPEGHDWLFIRHCGGDLMVVRRGAIGAEMLYEMWTAGRDEIDCRKPELRLRSVG